MRFGSGRRLQPLIRSPVAGCVHLSSEVYAHARCLHPRFRPLKQRALRLAAVARRYWSQYGLIAKDIPTGDAFVGKGGIPWIAGEFRAWVGLILRG